MTWITIQIQGQKYENQINENANTGMKIQEQKYENQINESANTGMKIQADEWKYKYRNENTTRWIEMQIQEWK